MRSVCHSSFVSPVLEPALDRGQFRIGHGNLRCVLPRHVDLPGISRSKERLTVREDGKIRVDGVHNRFDVVDRFLQTILTTQRSGVEDRVVRHFALRCAGIPAGFSTAQLSTKKRLQAAREKTITDRLAARPRQRRQAPILRELHEAV